MSSEIYFPVQHVCGDLYEQKIEIEKENGGEVLFSKSLQGWVR